MVKDVVAGSRGGAGSKVYVLSDGGGGFVVRPGTVVVDATVRAIRFGNATDAPLAFDFRGGPLRAEPPVLEPGQSGLVLIDWDSVRPGTTRAFGYDVTVGDQLARGNSSPTIIIDL